MPSMPGGGGAIGGETARMADSGQRMRFASSTVRGVSSTCSVSVTVGLGDVAEGGGRSRVVWRGVVGEAVGEVDDWGRWEVVGLPVRSRRGSVERCWSGR